MLMVQEEREIEGDELDRSLSLKRSRTSATCCWIKLITIRCGGAIPGRVTPSQERGAFSPGRRRDYLRSDTYYLFTLVQETEVISICHQCHRIVAGRDSHPDCLQPANRSYRVRKINPHQRTLLTGVFRFDWTIRVVTLIVFVMFVGKPYQVTAYVFSIVIVCNDSPADSETTVRSPKRPRSLPDLAGLHRRLLGHGTN